MILLMLTQNPRIQFWSFDLHNRIRQGETDIYGKPFGLPLGRSLTLAKDKEIGFQQESGHNKEISSDRNLTSTRK